MRDQIRFVDFTTGDEIDSVSNPERPYVMGQTHFYSVTYLPQGSVTTTCLYQLERPGNASQFVDFQSASSDSNACNSLYSQSKLDHRFLTIESQRSDLLVIDLINEIGSLYRCRISEANDT